jgi:hypothetical protein
MSATENADTSKPVKAINSPTLRELGDHFKNNLGYQVTYDDVQTEGVISSLTVESPVFGSTDTTVTLVFIELLVKGEGMISFFTHIKEGNQIVEGESEPVTYLSRFCPTARIRNVSDIHTACEKYTRFAFHPSAMAMHATIHKVLAEELAKAAEEAPIEMQVLDRNSGKEYGYTEVARMLQEAEAFSLQFA